MSKGFLVMYAAGVALEVKSRITRQTELSKWATPDHIPQIVEWGHSRNFEPKILVTGMWYCIADSLSHTTL